MVWYSLQTIWYQSYIKLVCYWCLVCFWCWCSYWCTWLMMLGRPWHTKICISLISLTHLWKLQCNISGTPKKYQKCIYDTSKKTSKSHLWHTKKSSMTHQNIKNTPMLHLKHTNLISNWCALDVALVYFWCYDVS